MSSLFSVFNNREIALAVWAFLFFAWILLAIDKKPLKSLLQAFFQKTIAISIVLMLLYIALIVAMLYTLGFWNISNLKDTILWGLGVAFVMLMNINSVRKEEHYFRKVILDNIKLILVLEFVIDFYVFDLWIEFLLVPALFFIAMMKAVVETNSTYKMITTLTNGLLSIVGIGLIVYSVVSLIGDLTGFFTTENLRTFLLTPILTAAFLPFVYLAALYIEFEQIFVRLKIFNKDRQLVRYAMWRILFTFHLDIGKLRRWATKMRVLKFESKDEIAEMLRQ